MAPPSHSQIDSDLITQLHKLSKASPKLVKSSIFAAPAEPNIMVRSWKMNEFKYYDVPSPFPTLARGLFSVELPADEAQIEQGKKVDPFYRIVARGYDKFFNIGEVPWSTWASIEARTEAPYILSLKANGCIIFIAALTPSKLLVTSKHSIGGIAGVELSHAEAGERWLRKYLVKVGKTEEQLAGTLWENNWTAVAELCDDSFEEHVLGYSPENTGLHLHGLNESTKAFKTLCQADVDAFADEWGFIKTRSVSFQSISEVKAFTDEVGTTGQWDGEAVEGFVVRTRVALPPADSGSTPASPYPPGSTFFFKIKFEEPYLMYRDWRELTKTILSTKGPLRNAKLSKGRMRRPETQLYVKWVTEQIEQDRSQFDQFTKGRGIISTRDKFLRWLEIEKGTGALKTIGEKKDVEVAVEAAKTFGKTIIVPVAIPGCGKTVISVALSHLFGFGHTQSDDAHGKKPAIAFVKNVVNLLKNHEVVIADKNNHLRQHREALRDATSKFSPPIRLLALNWSLDQPVSTVHRICCDRIVHRGENHQNLQADTEGKMHEDVVWQFIANTEALLDNEVDACIEMDLTQNLEDALHRAVEGCVRVLGVQQPGPGDLAEALNIAKEYTTTVKKSSNKKGEKKTVPRYFGLLPEVNIEELVDKSLELVDDLSEESKAFWLALKKDGRVAKRPHVTIVHGKFAEKEHELWERCMSLHRLAVSPTFKFSLGSIIWNDRVMAATVENLAVDVPDDDTNAQEFVSTLPRHVQDRLHITIGTRNAQIPPVEAMAMVESLPTGNKVESVKLNGIVLHGRVKGLFS